MVSNKNHIKFIFDRSMLFEHEYEGLETNQSLDDRICPFILDNTLRCIEAGVKIEKDLNVDARY